MLSKKIERLVLYHIKPKRQHVDILIIQLHTTVMVTHLIQLL